MPKKKGWLRTAKAIFNVSTKNSVKKMLDKVLTFLEMLAESTDNKVDDAAVAAAKAAFKAICEEEDED